MVIVGLSETRSVAGIPAMIMEDPEMSRERLVMVSNRVPASDGSAAAGGLAVGLDAALKASAVPDQQKACHSLVGAFTVKRIRRRSSPMPWLMLR